MPRMSKTCAAETMRLPARSPRQRDRLVVKIHFQMQWENQCKILHVKTMPAQPIQRRHSTCDNRAHCHSCPGCRETCAAETMRLPARSPQQRDLLVVNCNEKTTARSCTSKLCQRNPYNAGPYLRQSCILPLMPRMSKTCAAKTVSLPARSPRQRDWLVVKIHCQMQ